MRPPARSMRQVSSVGPQPATGRRPTGRYSAAVTLPAGRPGRAPLPEHAARLPPVPAAWPASAPPPPAAPATVPAPDGRTVAGGPQPAAQDPARRSPRPLAHPHAPPTARAASPPRLLAT